MDFKSYRIGYAPYSNDCSGPGDRRRFGFYAKEKGFDFELADPAKEYDIIYITTSSNIGKWIDYKKAHPGTKLIFEIIDAYLLEERNFMAYLKGVFRYFTLKDKRLYFNYQNAFINIIKIADAVVCSTPIQREYIKRYNTNVHVSLDYFSADIAHCKTSMQAGEKLKLVWEGQAYTVKNLLQLKDVFKVLADKIELHVITDTEIRYPFRIFNKKSENILKSLNCSYHLHKWEKETFSEIIAGCDLSIIPMDMQDKLIVNKPENKLLLLWEIGIPVITSATPAYKRVMDNAGLDYYCNDYSDWLNKLQAFITKMPQQRNEDMQKARNYLTKTHQKEQLVCNWDKIFSSVI